MPTLPAPAASNGGGSGGNVKLTNAPVKLVSDLQVQVTVPAEATTGAIGLIADELLRAGRRVYLSVGPHDRPPRAYRSKDFVWWLGALGKWNAKTITPGMEHVTIAVSGAHGGHTVDFRHLAHRGITLVGRTDGFADGKMSFAPDLKANIERGDANYLSVLNEADAHIAANKLDDARAGRRFRHSRWRHVPRR